METNKIIELLSYTLPALITGSVAYYFFQMHLKNEEGRRQYLLQKDLEVHAMPIRLQAYERMTLFLERISLSKILIRLTPISKEAEDYANFVIAHIEQEFDHNLAQQIYMSEECWDIIVKAKNATIHIIRTASKSKEVNSADQLREFLLGQSIEKGAPSHTALAYIKNEIKVLW